MAAAASADAPVAEETETAIAERTRMEVLAMTIVKAGKGAMAVTANRAAAIETGTAVAAAVAKEVVALANDALRNPSR